MQTRVDFVSNSSSSSFVINNDNNAVARALEAWARDFSELGVPYQVENITVSFRVKNKNYEKVKKELANAFPDNSFYSEPNSITYLSGEKPDDEELYPYSLQTSFGELPEMHKKLKKSTLNCIEMIDFCASDNDYHVALYLKLLYLYFERNMCMPDSSKSEQPFLGDDYGDNAFISKLCISGGMQDND